MAFDPYDKNSWYFGPMDRRDAETMLNLEEDLGVFLVRDSTTSKGDLVLCVKEDRKISHYIIHKILASVPIAPEASRNGAACNTKATTTTTQVKFRIGENTFTDIPGLLTYYKGVDLDTTPLVRPVRKAEQVIALYDFGGRDPDDLPFAKDEILTIVKKHDPKWWMAKNSCGRIGCIPVNYVREHCDSYSLINGLNGSACDLAELNAPIVSTNGATTITTIESNHHASNNVIGDKNNHNTNNNNVPNSLASDKNGTNIINSVNDQSVPPVSYQNGKCMDDKAAISSSAPLVHRVSLPSYQQNEPNLFPVNGNVNECNTRQRTALAMAVNSSSIDASASEALNCSSSSSPSSSSPPVSSSSVNCISSQISALHLNDKNGQCHLLQDALSSSIVSSTRLTHSPAPPLPVSVSQAPAVVTDCSSSTLSSSTQVTSSNECSSTLASSSSCPSSNFIKSTITPPSTVTSSVTNVSPNEVTPDVAPFYTLDIVERQLPAFARVIQRHTPNAYDRTALKLEIGDIIRVTNAPMHGQWEGDLNGKHGHFPFTHVAFIDSNNAAETDS